MKESPKVQQTTQLLEAINIASKQIEKVEESNQNTKFFNLEESGKKKNIKCFYIEINREEQQKPKIHKEYLIYLAILKLVPKLEPSMRGSGTENKRREWAPKGGLTGPDMRASGSKIKPMARASSSTLTALFMMVAKRLASILVVFKVNGWKIKRTVMESTLTQMAIAIRAIGEMTNSTARESKHVSLYL